MVAVAEALQVLLSWNPTWEPPYFMIDFSKIELNAVQSVFPHATIYICEFHCEQAWSRWIRSGMFVYLCMQAIIMNFVIKNSCTNIQHYILHCC